MPVVQDSPSVPPTDSSDLKHRLAWPFLGPNGLRALWRLVLFIAVVFGLRFGISAVLRVLHLVKPHPPITEMTVRTVFLQDGLALFCVLAGTIIMGAFEKRSLADYGLPMRGAFGARFFEGLVWGFAAEAATIVVLFVTGNVTFHGFALTGSAALQYALLWGVGFLLVGFFEELLFRGYPQFTLATGIGFWPAAVVLSGLFWLGHMGNPGETWVGGLSVALYALAVCVSLRLTGNLWFAIGMHAAGDWCETYFFGVPDSGMPAIGHLLNTTFSGSKWMTGGTVGPEGSVIELLIVMAVIGLLFVRFGRSERRLTAPLS
ncbi:MAG TPA: CPBP family intramembrane glutamic endopeptidase [Terriglobales bacterium]|nr:CPBP family intramembrane glutamic endopeptidase [Terriglobales bacterium]